MFRVDVVDARNPVCAKLVTFKRFYFFADEIKRQQKLLGLHVESLSPFLLPGAIPRSLRGANGGQWFCADCSEPVRPHAAHSVDQHQLAGLYLFDPTPLQPVQIHAAGQRPALAIPAIPTDGVGACLPWTRRQRRHPLSGQIE